jgi:two-component system CheB/CheR fusion protein
MAREGLRHTLTIALHKAVSGKETVHHPGLRVKTNGDFTMVNLTVRPVCTTPDSEPMVSLYLVVLEKVTMLHPEQTQQAIPVQAIEEANSLNTDARIEALKLELIAKDEYLQSFKEELETSNEELKSTNEEMQSVNEELQSTNEELETSKEELQSINEELSTVNSEFQTKVMDLSKANNDMNNLLSGTDIGSLFVDRKLRIMRFTPATTRIINLILSDVGRPMGHTVTNLEGYDRIVADAQDVLDTLIPKELEVLTTEGKWFMMRIMPYRTLDNVIEGVVITFVDISKIKRMQEELRRMAVVVRDANDAIIMRDMNGNILAWNPAAQRMYGWSEVEALKMKISALVTEKFREKFLAITQQLGQAENLEPALIERLTKDGQILTVQVTATALVNETGKVYAITTTERAM